MKRFAGIVLRKHWLKSSLLFLAVQVGAQNIPTGTWRTHFNYTSAKLLEKTGDKVFCAVESGLYSIDIADRSIRKLSKIDGLSGVDVSAMKYDVELNVLALGYTSGYVDLIFEDKIVSISEIVDSSLEGDKQVNSIQFFGSQIYFATGLGVVVANATSGEIRESFVQIGIDGAEEEALQLETFNGLLFARTEDGIQSGALGSNLLDFNNWTHYALTDNLSNLAVSNNQIFAISGQKIFQLSIGVWTDTNVDLPVGASRLFVDEENIYTATNSSIFQFSENQFNNVADISKAQVNDLLLVNNEYWVADDVLGLRDEAGMELFPDGPLSNQLSQIRVINSIVYGFHSPDPDLYVGDQTREEYSVFENGSWITQAIPGFKNVSDAVSFQGNLFFSSIGNGLYSQSLNEIITNIPESNAELDTVINVLAAGQNLWVSSFSNANPVHSFDGSNWTSFESTELLGNELEELVISETGILWYRRNGNVFVFDADERNVLALTGLPGSASDIEISLNDDPWVATTNGPINFSDASFIFNSSDAILPSFNNGTLFEGEPINATETDGGGRVWFATDRGLWIFDRNISNQEALFNVSNSPLPSDRVLNLTYNSRNGEMFVLTDKGLVSFRSASSNPSNLHNNVRVFPNPVQPEYSGLVGIEGLARDVTVKITDINGQLVKELAVNGGSASWDLRNVGSGEVVTGVYLFFSSSSDGIETYVGKIAVIR